jgi:hypothetical protein
MFFTSFSVNILSFISWCVLGGGEVVIKTKSGMFLVCKGPAAEQGGIRTTEGKTCLEPRVNVL